MGPVRVDTLSQVCQDRNGRPGGLGASCETSTCRPSVVRGVRAGRACTSTPGPRPGIQLRAWVEARRTPRTPGAGGHGSLGSEPGRRPPRSRAYTRTPPATLVTGGPLRTKPGYTDPVAGDRESYSRSSIYVLGADVGDRHWGPRSDAGTGAVAEPTEISVMWLRCRNTLSVLGALRRTPRWYVLRA